MTALLLFLTSAWTIVWGVIKALFQITLDVLKALWDFLVYFLRGIYTILGVVLRFLGPVATSVANQVNQEELYRVVVLAISTSAGTVGTLKLLHDNASTLVSDPNTLNFIRVFTETAQKNWLGASILVVMFFGDFWRRKYLHGDKVS